MNIGEKGLYTDCLEHLQPQGTYRYAKNIVTTNLFNTVENEDGFGSLSITTPYTFIGAIPINDDNFVVFSTNNTNSEIGLVEFGGAVHTYTVLYSSTSLGFNKSYPIKGVYRKNVNGDRLIAWVDGLNTLRILNIDDIASISSVDELNAFLDVNNPSTSSYSIKDSGGSLKTGSVILITKYENTDGTETPWFVHDHVFYINDDSKSTAFNENDGAAGGTITNKSVEIGLADCDTRFDLLTYGYIQIVNNITTVHKIGSKTNNTTTTLAITGTESTTDVTLDELLTPPANYTTVKSITELQGQLYAANVSVEPIPELQQAALDVRINYTQSKVNVISNTSNHKDSLAPGLMPGEVYAFYLGVEMNKGGWYLYHIAGRDYTGTEIGTVVDGGLTYTRYQVEDTADKVGVTTNMGFWRNENETYPNVSQYNNSAAGGRDLRNQRVLHHRFPTIDYLINRYYSSDQSVGVTHLLKLGISVSNVIIPSAIQSKIKRWKIFYAKKDESNSLMLGCDLWQPSVGTATDTTSKWSTGGNWALEAEQNGTDGWTDFTTPNKNTLRSHCLDFFASGTAPTPTYARFNYMLSRNNLNTVYSGFRSAGATMTITGEDCGQVASAVIDFTTPSQTTRAGTPFFRRLDNFTYLPANSLSGLAKSQYSEAVYVADISSLGAALNAATPIKLLTNSSGESSDAQQFRRLDGAEVGTAAAESTFYYTFCKQLSNVHVSFTQQDTIPLEGYYSPSTTTGTFSGGDTFMSYMSYLATAPTNGNPDSTLGNPYGEGVRMWKAYIGYSRYNFNYRYQTQGDLSTFYYGKTDVRTLFTPTVTSTLTRDYETLIRTDQSLNVVQYDTTLNRMNEFTAGVIYNTNIIQATSFPNTIIWSVTQNEDSQESSWKTFPVSNRYTIPKSKGDIVNIQSYKNKELLINTEESIYRTRTDTQIQTEVEDVFLRTGSLFALPPEELIPTTTGYAGCQHKFACVLTPAGYIFPDDKRGKVFLYNGSNLEEISSNGMTIFFRDFMTSGGTPVEDNPFNSTGYTVGYDMRFNRIIFTKKNSSTSWTLSYNPVRKQWISYHDYIPDYMFNSLKGVLYSSKSNQLYRNSNGSKGTYYGTTYSSFIDQVFNPRTDIKKLVSSVNWQTEVYSNTYLNGQPDTNLNYNTTCTHLTLRSPDHCTGRITLVPSTSIYDVYTANIRNQDRVWSFDEIRDKTRNQGFLRGFYSNFNIDTAKLYTNPDWYEQRYFIDKYVICRFEFDNVSDIRWILLDTNVSFNIIPQ